jgi:Na+/proline symporter
MELKMDMCHYCGSYTSNKNEQYHKKTLYGITKSHFIRGMGYSYIEKNVTIFRCESCYNKHGNHTLFIDLPIIILAYTFFFWFFHFKYDNYVNIVSVFITFIPTAFVWWILSGIVYPIVALSPKTGKFENDIEDFEEIKKLLEQGWLMSKPPKGTPITDEDIVKN